MPHVPAYIATKRARESEEELDKARLRIAQLERLVELDADKKAALQLEEQNRALALDLEARGVHIAELYKVIAEAAKSCRAFKSDEAAALLEAVLPAMAPATAAALAGASLLPETRSPLELGEAKLAEAKEVLFRVNVNDAAALRAALDAVKSAQAELGALRGAQS